ncbi:FAD-dependent oxidoreductase [Saccharopolyspora karakumensis]|uniref:FAD-dependent oxidoreductase n=1 Tax=Saccharopolyspora karakumensis TaxID=2530386 RepID=A0A4R5BIB0_9PSEU|nr:FAD-binding oxidoreductase [Saccharopolyspora karakumensis]TDD83462.1 FAD-dependent oxidoreductase [Saccharopolyspora karakumensis]
MKDKIPASGTVYWLEQAMEADDQPACPPLSGNITADVVIVGGGYLGLWTAIDILENAPETRVVLLEAQSCGFGASGRNGGWATGWHDELDVLVRRFGVEEACRLAERSAWAIDRIGEVCDTYGIECDLRRQGATKAATTDVQMGKWQSALDACQQLGRSKYYVEVDGQELRRRTGSPLPLAGVSQTDGATLQPALLARGLRRVALKLGATIYEGTPMISLDRGYPARVGTPAGSVLAERVVLATGAWMASIPELRRAIVPIGSSIVVTEPLGERLLSRPFGNGEGIGDLRMSVHYMQVTPDGRLLFGRGGGPLGRAGQVQPALWHDPRTLRSIERDLRRWFPDLADARITHGWSGPVDRSPGHFPFIGKLGDHGTVHYATGLSGSGVAQSALLGRTLAHIVLGIEDDDTRSPITRGPVEYLPPEPFRSVGGLAVRAAVEYVEEAQERGKRLNVNGVLRKLIATTTPRLLEPRLRGSGK